MADDNWGTPITLGDRRVLRPGRLLWLRALGWLVLSIFAVALAFGVAGQSIADLAKGGSEPLRFAARCAGPVIAVLAYGLLVYLGEARLPVEIAARPAVPHLAAGMALGALMFSVTMLILIASGIYEFHYIGLAPAWQNAGSSIEAGVIEEVLVRGLILRLMWRAFGPLAAFFVSAVAFGIGHLGNDNATLFAILCIALEAGIMLAAFYALTGRLWVSIGVHIGWNFTQAYAFGAVVSGQAVGSSAAVSSARPPFPDWLTGGPFGPEASLPSVMVCSSVGAATLWLAWKLGRFGRAERQQPAMAPA